MNNGYIRDAADNLKLVINELEQHRQKMLELSTDGEDHDDIAENVFDALATIEPGVGELYDAVNS